MTDFERMPSLEESTPTFGGRFDYSLANSLKNDFLNAGLTVDRLAAGRASLVSTASAEFRGHFSELFAQNQRTASTDAANLSSALKKVSEYLGQFATAAREEDARRKENNEWVDRRNNRDAWTQFCEWWGGEPPRPNLDPVPGPSFSPYTPPVAPRETPAVGNGSGGTSSARPEDLRAFASGARSADTEIQNLPGTLNYQLSLFASTSGWATLDASGVISAFKSYVAANAQDTTWADTIAAAFEAAGAGNGATASVSDAELSQALAAAGVSEGRTTLQIDPPTAAGAMPSTGYADDPVNTATGNFIEPETDLRFDGLAGGLTFTRMYNSLPSALTEPGVFGPGWASLLDQRLNVGVDGVRWVRPDGRAVDFPREGEGWARGVGENYWLAAEPAAATAFASLASIPEGISTLLVARDNQGTWSAYTHDGAWLGSGGGAARTVSVVRDPSGDVVRLEHELGRFIEIDYADGRVAVLTASDGRRREYEYGPAGHLVGVRSEVGLRSYRVNETGVVDRVVAATGVVEVSNTYDAQGRVATQESQHGRTTRYAYLPGRVTSVADLDGTRSNGWIHDVKGRLVGVLDAHGRRQSMSYDPHGNLVSLTERDGSVTVHAYDERGRRVRTVTPEGGDLSYGYDEFDRVTTVVSASGAVVSYEYPDDTSRDPSVIHDPLGGSTLLEIRGGLVRAVSDAEGVTLRFGHNAFGELTSITNAVGDTATLERDGAGRVVATVTPLGAVTRFGYDAAGQLVSRQDADGGQWIFERDAQGRLLASVEPTGARTRLRYGAHGEVVEVVDALGRVTSRSLDDLGNVASVTLPDGGRWKLQHDALSRLTSVTSPGGHEWGYEYSVIGELSALIDPTGVRSSAANERSTGVSVLRDAFGATQVKHDEFGRPTAVTTEDGSSELVSYDAMGQPVELVDGEGGLTVLRRDRAGRITGVRTPMGAETSFEYDACGRPWRTTDPAGAVTELHYDADQRVVRRTLPGGEEESFSYDVMGRLLVRRAPGGRVSQYGYDKAGRLTFAQDPWFGTRRFAYDAVGELIGTTNGVGGKTTFERDSLGRVVRVIDPLGAVTEREYSAIDRVTSQRDPLGRVTTAEYDPAGRLVRQTTPDGTVTRWEYDDAGRESSVSVNGRVVSRIHRDLLERTVTLCDTTAEDGLEVEHTLRFNGRGQLVERTRGASGLAWEYDADGRRLAFTDADGVRTSYERDAAGRIVAAENARLGRAVFAYSAAGRLVSSRAGTGAGVLAQSWEYRGGLLREHTRSAEGREFHTALGYDDEGRVSSVSAGGAVTRYSYDGAGQLVRAATGALGGGDESVAAWEYDAGGRLLRESGPTGETRYRYDEGAQLVSLESPSLRTEFAYDERGRRIRAIHADGSWVEYMWGALGYLGGVVNRSADGQVTSSHSVHVDVLGEAASIDEIDAWWDTAAPLPALASLGGEQVLQLPGGVTGLGEQWQAPGWREARATTASDPWAVLALGSGTEQLAGRAGGLPEGIGLSPTGGLTIAGLEWLGARSYDPLSRGFLSTDPLAPVLGAGWDGNPYSYAGNNPLGATDPTGLSPLTDTELAEFDKSSGSHWEYVVGGLAVAGAVVAMFVPGLNVVVAGAIVGGLASGGISVISQKAQTGTVDWWSVAGSTVVGAATGAAGGGAALWAKGLMASAPAGQAAAAVTASAVANGAVGATGSGLSYLAQHGWGVANGWDFAGAMAGGGLAGTVGGLAGPMGGSIARIGGQSATGAVATVSTAAINGLGAAGGSALSDAVAGRPVDPTNAAASGLFGSAASAVPVSKIPGMGQQGVDTLQQMPYFAPRTPSGMFNLTQPNTVGLWGGASGGAAVGFGGDMLKESLGW